MHLNIQELYSLRYNVPKTKKKNEPKSHCKRSAPRGYSDQIQPNPTESDQIRTKSDQIRPNPVRVASGRRPLNDYFYIKPIRVSRISSSSDVTWYELLLHKLLDIITQHGVCYRVKEMYFFGNEDLWVGLYQQLSSTIEKRSLQNIEVADLLYQGFTTRTSIWERVNAKRPDR